MNDNNIQRSVDACAQRFLVIARAGLEAWRETWDDRACGEWLAFDRALEHFVDQGLIRSFDVVAGTLTFNDGTTFGVDS